MRLKEVHEAKVYEVTLLLFLKVNFVGEQCRRSSSWGGERCGGGWWCSSYKYKTKSKLEGNNNENLCDNQRNLFTVMCVECAFVVPSQNNSRDA